MLIVPRNSGDGTQKVTLIVRKAVRLSRFSLMMGPISPEVMVSVNVLEFAILITRLIGGMNRRRRECKEIVPQASTYYESSAT